MANTLKLSSLKEFVPKLFKVVRSGYTAKMFGKDIFSGFTVGVVALPLAVVFSIGAGGTPAQGLWTCIIAGVSCAALGGSRYLVSGPTGALLVITAGILAQYGMPGLFLATFMAGIMSIIMGVAGLGKIIKYMPYPVTTGFTTGIGFMIAGGQLKDLFGLKIDNYATDLMTRLGQVALNMGSFDYKACLVGLATIGLIVLVRKAAPRIPAAVVAIVLVSLAAFLLRLPVETIGSRYGSIPKGFPPFGFPEFQWETVRAVFPSAVTIAILGSIITVMSAVVSDGLSGDRHDANMELVAQGAGNILASLFGGIPSTGAVARTVVNIKNGAASPISAIVHAAVLLVFTLFLGGLTKVIPLAALSGVLLVVAWDMSDLRRFMSMRYAPKSDNIVMLATFALAVVFNLSIAVEVGVVLAILLFLKRMMETTYVRPILDAQDADISQSDGEAPIKIPAGVEMFEINGPFFFGTADYLQEALDQIENAPIVFIIRMRRVPSIDATGLNALEAFRKDLAKHDTVLVLSGVREQPRKALDSIGLAERIGEENIVPTIDTAIALALSIIDARLSAKALRHARLHLDV